MNIKIFINNLKTNASTYRYRFLKYNQFNLINDKASDYKYTINNTEHHQNKPRLINETLYKWK